MGLLTHNDIITIGQALGYDLPYQGVCRGYTMMLLQAVCVGEYAQFEERLQRLELYKQYTDEIDEINIQIAEKEEAHNSIGLSELLDGYKSKMETLKAEIKKQNYLDVLAFFDGLYAYQEANMCPWLFDYPVLQNNISEISQLISPIKLGDKAKLSIHLNSCHLFSDAEVTSYFKGLEDIFVNHPDMAILLDCNSHSIGCYFEKDEKEWRYVDINQYYSPSGESYFKKCEPNNFAELIRLSFPMASHGKKNPPFNIRVIGVHTNSALQEELAQYDAGYAFTQASAPDATMEQLNLFLSIAIKNSHLEVTKLLLDRGADIHQPNNFGATLLHVAAFNGHFEVAKLLLDGDADINRLDNNGATPLNVAVSKNCLEVVKLLLERGADTHQPNNYGATPLHVAAYKGHLEVAKLLLERGADINRLDKNGATPLHVAAQQGQLDILRILIEEGADLDAKNKNNKDVFMIAQEVENQFIIDVLNEFKAKQINSNSVNSLEVKSLGCNKNAFYCGKSYKKDNLIEISNYSEEGIQEVKKRNLSSSPSAVYGV